VTDAQEIHTTRLRLALMRTEALSSLLEGDAVTAGEFQGVAIPSAFLDSVNESFLTRYLEQMLLRPSRQGWGVRAIIREHDGLVIGHCGFHGPPEVIGRAEIGYTIFEAYRENGYATEAARGLVDWARLQGSKVVFAAVSPNNPSSLRVIEKAGFRRTTVQVDEIDGEEYVFEVSL
jgi:RimJ/RimL family protein N-acetyltransferase